MIERKILLLLIGVREDYPTSYELIRLFTKRFEIYNYTEIINKCIEDTYIERIDYPSREMGSYKLTKKGQTELEKINITDFELELLDLYPERIDFIRQLIMQIKK